MKEEDILNTLTENIDNARIRYWEYDLYEGAVCFIHSEWLSFYLKVDKIYFKGKCTLRGNTGIGNDSFKSYSLQTFVIRGGLFNRVRLTEKHIPDIWGEIAILIIDAYKDRERKKTTEIDRKHCERRQKKINKGINKLSLIDGS